MKRLFLASNQLPVTINKNGSGFDIQFSEELTISGLEDFYSEYETKWIGHVGVDDEEFSIHEKHSLRNRLEDFECIPVFPEIEDYNLYLHEFSKNTIWPLFHYFTQNAVYDDKSWEAYVRVNQQYADQIIELIDEDDMLWIHDFHLMLLPNMIKKKLPGISIGLFLHIPFPSFEIFQRRRNFSGKSFPSQLSNGGIRVHTIT